MSYFAAAATREAGTWTVTEMSLADAADVEDVADQLRDIEPAAEVSLLFVESDDAYLAILRLDNGEDLRVFASDAAFAEDSRLGALLLSDLTEPEGDLATVVAIEDVPLGTAGEEVAEVPTTLADAEPAGDPELLADLGVPTTKLLRLCRQEGMLPSDITAEVCQAIGCGDEVEELREA